MDYLDSQITQLKHAYSNRVLPSVYGDELSYYESVTKMIYIVEQILEMQRDWVDWTNLNPIINDIKTAIETNRVSISALNNNLSNYKLEVNTRFIATNKRIDDLKEWVIIDQEEQNKYLTNLFKALVLEVKYQMMNYTDTQLAIFKEWAEDEHSAIYKKIDELEKLRNKIFNPTNGKYEDVAIVVDDLYSWLRYEAIECLVFDNIGITASYFDTLQLTAKKFDHYAKTELTFNFNHGGFSPFSGEKESYMDMINELANFHRGEWDASGYDSKGYTAEAFSNLNWSAYHFDFINYSNL